MAAKTRLELNSTFSLPLEVAGEATAILATRGAGKSYTSAVLVEELHDAGVPVVVLDPTGVYWGLRGKGASDGLPIYIFGGEHGDLPLEATAGDVLADLAAEGTNSFVLDLSSFESKGAQSRFVRSFAERLYRRKAANRGTLHLIIDEADEFAPQKPLGRDEPFMLGALEAIVRRGRSRGLGCTLITQRSAALNKNVLALAETLIIMRTPGPHDRKAIEGWISHHALAGGGGVLDTLPGLRTGTAWVWSPVRDILEQIDIREIKTFDSYRTPKPGEIAAQPRKMAEIDLDDLGARMAATVERVKASDPTELRKRIIQLEKQLQSRPVEEKIQEVAVEIPVLGDSDIADLETVVHELRGLATEIIEPIIVKADEIILALSERKSYDERNRRTVASASRATKPVAAVTPAVTPVSSNGFKPTDAQQRVINAVAWLESTSIEADRLRVALLAGYRQSGNFNNIISKLSSADVLIYPTPGAVELTDLGRDLAVYPIAALTTADLRERVMEKLKPAQQRVFAVILDAYEGDISREELAAQTGYTQSGNFNNLVSSLTSLGVIARSGPGRVRAEDLMFVK